MFEYNTQGQLIKKTLYNSDGSIDHYSIFEYNTQGQLIKKFITNPTTLLIIILFMNTISKTKKLKERFFVYVIRVIRLFLENLVIL
ncbi:DUF2963 domain-containing protein [Candidatus Phytoplasma solani]|uniref:DUF2963 domain-containing protein n=1 Tax=Candidatus Phytoplasma solani TaxID=69896 RepID=UPI00358FBD4D